MYPKVFLTRNSCIVQQYLLLFKIIIKRQILTISQVLWHSTAVFYTCLPFHKVTELQSQSKV